MFTKINTQIHSFVICMFYSETLLTYMQEIRTIKYAIEI